LREILNSSMPPNIPRRPGRSNSCGADRNSRL
jgi:hypothetical protein